MLRYTLNSSSVSMSGCLKGNGDLKGEFLGSYSRFLVKILSTNVHPVYDLVCWSISHWKRYCIFSYKGLVIWLCSLSLKLLSIFARKICVWFQKTSLLRNRTCLSFISKYFIISLLKYFICLCNSFELK